MNLIGSFIGRRVTDILLLVLVVLALLPFGYMIVTSIQRTSSISLEFRPERFTLEHYARLFDTQGFGFAMLTSSVVVVIAIVLNVSLSSLAAFGFSKRPFVGSEKLYFVYIATMMVPAQVTLIPLFLMMKNLGLLNTYLSLAIPVVNAFGVFLIREFIDSIPDELIDAARMDGASDFRIFIAIVLPLCRPVMIALTVFTFLTVWNDFLWPLVTITDNKMRTVPLVAASLNGILTSEYGGVMAAATVAFAVPLLAYIVLQRHFVAGIASSGIKG